MPSRVGRECMAQTAVRAPVGRVVAVRVFPETTDGKNQAERGGDREPGEWWKSKPAEPNAVGRDGGAGRNTRGKGAGGERLKLMNDSLSCGPLREDDSVSPSKRTWSDLFVSKSPRPSPLPQGLLLPTSLQRISPNPKGIAPSSPGLRGTSNPGTTEAMRHNPNGVASASHDKSHNPVGVAARPTMFSQGSSCLA